MVDEAWSIRHVGKDSRSLRANEAMFVDITHPGEHAGTDSCEVTGVSRSSPAQARMNKRGERRVPVYDINPASEWGCEFMVSTGLSSSFEDWSDATVT